MRKTREFKSISAQTKTTPGGSSLFGGEGEIRTRGELPHDGFQDRYLKPLGHLSVLCEIYIIIRLAENRTTVWLSAEPRTLRSGLLP